MSSEATGWVYRHSPYKGAVFAVHHAVADSVNDQGDNEFFMRQRRLAHKARVSRPTANQAIAELVESGFLTDLGEYPNRLGLRWFRFEFPEVEVVYESRQGVISANTPVSSANTPSRPSEQGVLAETTGGVSSANTGTQREPKEEPLVAKATERDLATAVVKRWWEEQEPRPPDNYIGLVKIVEGLIHRGWTQRQVYNALKSGACTRTAAGLDAWMRRARDGAREDPADTQQRMWRASDPDPDPGRHGNGPWVPPGEMTAEPAADIYQ